MRVFSKDALDPPAQGLAHKRKMSAFGMNE